MPYGALVDAGSCLLALSAEGGSDGAGGFAGPHLATCLEPGLAAVRWRYSSASEFGTFRPRVVDGAVTLGRQGSLVAVSAEDGSVRWERPVDGLPRGLGGGADTLYVGTLSGTVFALPLGSTTARGSPR